MCSEPNPPSCGVSSVSVASSWGEMYDPSWVGRGEDIMLTKEIIFVLNTPSQACDIKTLVGVVSVVGFKKKHSLIKPPLNIFIYILLWVKLNSYNKSKYKNRVNTTIESKKW